MRFRFTLQHAVLGSEVINEPDGWKDSVLKLERDNEFHSLIEHYEGGAEGSFVFYGDNGRVNGGINFIKQVEQTYGFNGSLSLIMEHSDQDDNVYETLYTWQLDLSTITEFKDNKLSCAIIRDDLWSRFINKVDTPVDLLSSLDLYENAASSSSNVTLRMTPQEVRLVNHSKASTFSVIDVPSGVLDKIQVDWDEVVLDDLKTKYHIPIDLNPELPAWIFSPDYPGSYVFDIQLYMTVFRTSGGSNQFRAPDGGAGEDNLNFYIQINNSAAIAFSESLASGNSIQYTYSATHSLLAGDIIRIYGISDAAGLGRLAYVFLGADSTGINAAMPAPPAFGLHFDENNTFNSYLKITGDTIHNETDAQGFLIYDVPHNILNRILGYSNRFLSVFFSSGCGYTNMLLKGLQVRGYTLTEKPFFISFNQWWKGVNPMFNLGLGYTTVAGIQKIEVEEKHNFYDDSSVSVYFSNVRDITREYDTSRIYNKIEIGYQKWEAEGISGLDDPQTKKEYSTIIEKVKNSITLFSEFIAASLTFEKTRREGLLKAKDYKYDNEVFIVSINPTAVDTNVYVPELDENFDGIGNLVNSPTRYNSRHTPARAFIRWRNYFNGFLQKYLSSVYKFVKGEGNYDMTSELSTSACRDNYNSDELSEKQNIPVTTDYIHLPELYNISVPMSKSEYLAITSNRKKAIAISQTTTGHVKFFIKSLSFQMVKGKATIQAWPKTPFTMRVIQ